jgi:hypothetical protein
VVPNAETGANEFVLLRVDRTRLAALIAQRVRPGAFSPTR